MRKEWASIVHHICIIINNFDIFITEKRYKFVIAPYTPPGYPVAVHKRYTRDAEINLYFQFFDGMLYRIRSLFHKNFMFKTSVPIINFVTWLHCRASGSRFQLPDISICLPYILNTVYVYSCIKLLKNLITEQ